MKNIHGLVLIAFIFSSIYGLSESGAVEAGKLKLSKVELYESRQAEHQLKLSEIVIEGVQKATRINNTSQSKVEGQPRRPFAAMGLTRNSPGKLSSKLVSLRRRCILHSGPHNLSEDIRVIGKGKRVRVVKAKGNWYHGKLSPNQKGYLNGNCFE